MMAIFGDIDRDGFLDLFVASPDSAATGTMTTQKLCHNDGDGSFTDSSEPAGIATALGGCVAGFSDFNLDGLPDLLVGNCNLLDTSGPVPFPIVGPWEMWINQGDLTFVDVASEAGLGDWEWGWGASFADFDGDGFVDIVIGKTAFDITTENGQIVGDGEPVLIRNLGNRNRSVTLRLRGTDSNSMGIGARIEVYTRQGKQVRELAAGSSFASTNSPWPTFGLGRSRKAAVVVRWPSGHRERFDVVADGGLETLTEGTGQAL